MLGGIAFTSSKRAGVTMPSAMIALYVLGGLAVRMMTWIGESRPK